MSFATMSAIAKVVHPDTRKQATEADLAGHASCSRRGKPTRTRRDDEPNLSAARPVAHPREARAHWSQEDNVQEPSR
jgi:hypothetical protein